MTIPNSELVGRSRDHACTMRYLRDTTFNLFRFTIFMRFVDAVIMHANVNTKINSPEQIQGSSGLI